MQRKTATFFSIIVIALFVEIKASLSTPSADNLGPSTNINNATLSEKNRSVQTVQLKITNDGPTVLGSETIFTVTVLNSLKAYFSYQWGTFIPYRWMYLRTYNNSVQVKVDWWKITGSESVYFYVDVFESQPDKWIRVAVNSSSVEVIDYLSMSTILTQHHQIINDRKIETGVANFVTNIHDPSNFFKGLIIHFTWMFNDGTPTKSTTWNSMDHTFKSEGLFYVQVSSRLKKDGKLYTGQSSFYVSVKARLTGYILAWKNNEQHPTLPSKEKSLSIGLANFQFKIVDNFSSFTNATFTYTWNYGDGTIREGFENTTHVYNKPGNLVVFLGVSASQYGRGYHSLIYKNISVREPIKDLDVKSHSRLKKGTAVQFNISCKGSAPLSFCWYVARGSCKLPSDVICSPTRLYHNCKNTISHTFHHTGDYCVNVTVVNTVSFAEKSINVQVAEEDQSRSKRNHSAVTAAAILPIIAGLLLFIVLYLGIKHKMQHCKRLARKSEVATFDFRSSQFSLHKTGAEGCCPFLLDCKGWCPSDEDVEDDHEMEERRTFLEEEPGSNTPKRKVSYYGSIHRILGQSHVQEVQFEVNEGDPSPFTPRRNLSKSV